MIDPHQELSDQPRCQKLYAHQSEQNPEHEKRPAADICIEENLFRGKPGQDAKAKGQHRKGNATKGVDRPV